MEDKSQDSELDDLRYRISQLENLVVTKTLDFSFSSSFANNTNPSTETVLERSSQLESLLAASELDNKKLTEDVVFLATAIKRLQAENEEKLKEKNKEILDLKYEAELYQKKNEVSERKLRSIETYINTLPSEEELTEANVKVKTLEGQVLDLQRKLERCEWRAKTLQKELFEKESQYQDAILKLDELKPLEEAQENVVKDEKLDRLNFSDTESIRQLIIVLKAELVRSKNIISSYREKVTELNDSQAQYSTKLSSLSLLLNESREQYYSLSTQNDNLNDKLRNINLEYRELSTKFEELQSRTTRVLECRELRQEQYESVIRLVSEIDFCVSEMNNSVELGHKLLRNEEPEVDLLVGLTDFDFNVDIRCSEESTQDEEDTSNTSKLPPHLAQSLNKVSLEGDLNVEWCLEKWEHVRTSRKELASLRSSLSDMYAQRLGGKCSGCPVQ